MARSFTYCWQHREMRKHPAGEPIRFAYGSQFSRRGVCPDDELFIVSVHAGRVYLLGKVLVGPVAFCPKVYLEIVGEEPKPALEYIIADALTPARLIPVPDELVRQLRFRRGKQLVGLTFRAGALVDRQSLRSVRRLSRVSAKALDALLPAMEPLPQARTRPNHPVPQKVSACRYCELHSPTGQPRC